MQIVRLTKYDILKYVKHMFMTMLAFSVKKIIGHCPSDLEKTLTCLQNNSLNVSIELKQYLNKSL